MPKCAALQTSTGNMEVFFKSHFKISKQSQKPTIDFNYLITTKKHFFKISFFSLDFINMQTQNQRPCHKWSQETHLKRI